ncbi:MAG: hypothetical protein JWR09_2309 [Mucilaginibacter sp.]|nr:hypothetical protein [Mucilaginibacter sp.]
MSKGDQKSTNKASNKPIAGPKDPLRSGAKPAGKAKAPSTQAATADQPETSRPKTKNVSKTGRPGPKAVPRTINSNPDSNRDENLTSEITNMEVHHHPQLEHKPKPFKEYLLEGFMIFIAVMMGFIAENIRETIGNNEHVRQLTSQLARDLRADTAQLNVIYRAEKKIERYNDTLLNLLQQPLQKADTRKIQKQVANSHSMWLFHPSSGAMAAIKNELHLKQFSNSEIISYFVGYERDTELLHTDQDINLQYQRTYLDPFITLHFIPANMVAAFADHSVPTGQMRNLTQGDLDQLAADMVLIRIVTHEMIRDNVQAKTDAVEMLRYITRQYHLEYELKKGKPAGGKQS